MLEKLRNTFKPEFLNRIDEIIVFKPLDKQITSRIVELQLEGLQTRLADEGIMLELKEDVRRLIAEEGFVPEYGARPLSRTIQRLIENPLSKLLIEGSFKDGDTVVVRRVKGKIEFSKK